MRSILAVIYFGGSALTGLGCALNWGVGNGLMIFGILCTMAAFAVALDNL